MNDFKGKRVLVVGLGLSGVSAARYLVKQGAQVTVTDLKEKAQLTSWIEACADLPIEYDLGKHQSKAFTSAECIVVSPGVPLTLKPLQEAKEKGIPITNEIEIGAALLNVPVVAVTGTNGKTTTTTLIGEMLKASGKSVFVGGNIGKPLLDYFNESLSAEIVVLELSSFQLELIQKLKVQVSVFTNIQETHMDRYPDLNAYIQAKKRLLKLSDPKGLVILNADDPKLSSFKDESPSPVAWFAKKLSPKTSSKFTGERITGAFLESKEKKLVFRANGQDEIYSYAGFRVFGEHNRENLMAAILAAKQMGASKEAIESVIQSFPGVPHRLEFVRKKDGVFFFNDSKGTNVQSVSKSLQSFQANPVILIAGGKDRNSDFLPLVPFVRQHCKLLVLVGEAKEKINRALGDFVETYLVGTFEEAILLAYQKSRRGDVVLLSPGCSSQDMFQNFEERGDYYKKLVARL